MSTNSVSTFTTIPFEDIKEFLGPSFSGLFDNPDWTYQVAREHLLERRPDRWVQSLSLIDYLLAQQYRGSIKIKYLASSILQRPEKELSKLARSLGLNEINRERIIRILGFLNLLDNDLSVFDRLPWEILVLIGSSLNCRSLSFFTRISRRFRDLAEGKLVGMIQTKLHLNTGLEVSHYSKEELGFLGRRERSKWTISAGWYHSLFLDDQGEVLTCGVNARGQLGLGHTQSEKTPQPIKSFRIGPIIAIAGGGRHSLILNNQGETFIFGNYRDLTINHIETYHCLPKIIEAVDLGKIKALATGAAHSLLLNHRGQVFSFGSNDSGQLGLGDNKYRDVPTLMTSLILDEIIAIASRQDHSLLLNKQGRVYSCGNNGKGQLGRGELKVNFDQSLPLLISSLKIGSIIAISAGGSHSLICNSHGQVFSFGDNHYGQLGLGDRNNRSIPTLITHYGSEKIIAISAGRAHSLLLNSHGQVFSFGHHRDGQLGHEMIINSTLPKPILIPENKKITIISAGGDHSLLIDEKDRLFSFGCNNYGQLGLGDTDNRKISTRINLIVDQPK
jgi:alpha-tubulin suppressor-like RCC1 family protein